MDYYDIWFNLKDAGQEEEFCTRLDAYAQALMAHGTIEGYALRRRKLGFGPPGLGEFNVTVETKDLAQLDEAVRLATTRNGEVESLHRALREQMKDLEFGLSQDYPDAPPVGTEAELPFKQQEMDKLEDTDARRASKKSSGQPTGARRKKRRRWSGPIG